MQWLQRYKEREIKEENFNTRYYHAKANGRRTKNRITSLEQDQEVIEGQGNLIKYITNFYKDLFGHAETSPISLNIDNIDLIPNQDVEDLTKPFTLDELGEVVFGMEKNKSPGPDGFPADFYQHFWEIVKTDLMNLLNDFHNGDLDTTRLNCGIVTLVPKTKDVKQIQKFSPLCLLNVAFKIITKILMKRLSRVVNPMISHN